MRVAQSDHAPRCLPRHGVVYESFSECDAREYAQMAVARTRDWIVTIEDHSLCRVVLDEMERLGRYAFAPLPFVEMGKQPRLTGDGPASWTCWIGVSRPKSRRFSGWGSLPGAYVPPLGVSTQRDRLIKGGKPMWLMQALVRDYSRPGDLVCDPYAGGGTTLLAAVTEGRRAIGAECDPATFELAVKRLRAGHTRSLFTQRKREPEPETGDLFGSAS